MPEEDEVVVPKEAVVVTVPADFTLEESCQALVTELAATIYRWGLFLLLLYKCRYVLARGCRRYIIGSRGSFEQVLVCAGSTAQSVLAGATA